ncbi:hypothetical protein IMX26_15155 [Clostridium sp. 'deep sea']|uniref:hypothetical protein n=1 Tax=Clostridium sp. 'deep sea' TaxID=2779445 RepID=UPI00189686DE|nr:hypothetical protein [Clostridium sp. 'deep sea']QOR34780.1 hypothetical protein IMX26_15155 [Clostridium sp. 'deep sea']
MKKIGLITLVIVITLAVFSALYMQTKLYKGEPYFYAPHEFKGEVLKRINQNDMFYSPIWCMLLAVGLMLGYNLFKVLIGTHSYYSTPLYLLMVLLYMISIIALFKAYYVIGQAMILTSKTGEFLMGFFEIMGPFIFIFLLCGINEIIKFYNLHYKKIDDCQDRQRFNVLKNILKNKN